VNKAELVEETADQPELARKISTEAIGAAISAVTDSLARERRNYFGWFWDFSSHGKKSKKREESSNRTNYPNTGKEVPEV